MIYLLDSSVFNVKEIDTFFSGADSFLIAHALVNKYVVVSLEIAKNSNKKITIPDVCNLFNIEHILPYDMLRRENARFILQKDKLFQY